MPKFADDTKNYDRKPLSNREGFKRLEEGLEKERVKKAGAEKICDICHRRVRAYRIVPATFGTHLGKVMAHASGGLKGKFVVACDNGPESCAVMLEKSGVAREGIREQEAVERLGKLGIVVRS